MNYIEDIDENLVFGESYEAGYFIRLNINDSFQITDGINSSNNVRQDITDNLTYTDSVFAGKKITLNINENISYHDDFQAVKVVSILFEDSFNYSEQYSNNFNYIESLVDNMNFNAIFSTYAVSSGNITVDRNYDCWVVNKESNAFSRYTNYYFNSFCKLNDKYYGANESGIFELTGNSDNGDNIESKIVTGKIDVSNIGSLSYVRDVILYLKTDGTVRLNIKASDGKEETYRLTTTNNEVKSNRIVLSKGRKAVYWQFELTNDGVSSFELENTKVYRVITQRLS